MKLTGEMILKAQLSFIDSNGNELSDMKMARLRSMLKEYYFGKKAVAIVFKNFGIKMSTTQFAEKLPVVSVSEKCPYDQHKMVSQLPAKTNVDDWPYRYTCPKCKHTVDDKNIKYQCQCENCVSKRQMEQKKREEFVGSFQGNKVDISALSARQRLQLATLLQGFNATRLTALGSFQDYRGLVDFDVSLIKSLIHERLLSVSSKSNAESIPDIDYDKGSFEYYPDEVLVDVEVTDSSVNMEDSGATEFLLENLKNLTYVSNLDTVQLRSLYVDIVRREMFRITQLELHKFHFEIEKDAEITTVQNAINRWLTSLSPAELYSVIWRAARFISTDRTEGKWGGYQYHPMKYFVLKCDGIIAEHGGELEKYHYPFSGSQFLQTDIFFLQMVKIPDWFERLLPLDNGEIPDTQHMQVSVLSKMLEQRVDDPDEDSIERIVSEAEWYEITKYGIVVSAKNVNTLYTDQLTAFDRFSMEFGGYFDEISTIDWPIEYIPEYKVKQFYSLQFLFILEKALRESDVKYGKNPEEKNI